MLHCQVSIDQFQQHEKSKHACAVIRHREQGCRRLMEEVGISISASRLPISILQGELQKAWRLQVGLLTCALALLSA